MLTIYFIEKGNSEPVVPWFLQASELEFKRCECALCSLGQKTCCSSIALQDTAVGCDEDYIYVYLNYHCNVLDYKKRIQGTLRLIFYPLIPAGRSGSRDRWPPECAPCSLVQKMSDPSLTLQVMAFGHCGNYLKIYIAYFCNISY